LAKQLISINFALSLIALLSKRRKHSTSSQHCIVIFQMAWLLIDVINLCAISPSWS